MSRIDSIIKVTKKVTIANHLKKKRVYIPILTAVVVALTPVLPIWAASLLYILIENI